MSANIIASLIQPIDRVIICAVEFYYRLQKMRQLLIHIDAHSDIDDFAYENDTLKPMHLWRRSLFWLLRYMSEELLKKTVTEMAFLKMDRSFLITPPPPPPPPVVSKNLNPLPLPTGRRIFF